MSSLPKPVLRGYFKRKSIALLATGGLCAGLLSLSLQFFYKKPRAKAYEEFLKTYDADAHYKDLVKWGYLKSLTKDSS